MSDIKERIRHLKVLLEKRRETVKAFTEITAFLTQKGIEKEIAEEVLLRLGDQSAWNPKESVKETLQNELSLRIRTTGGFCFSERAPILAVLVGPTGVGKTTTVLKLAHRYGVEKKKKIGLIALDEEKAGAFQQLERYASYWKIPLFEGFKNISALKECELILVDTTGCNFYLPQQVDRLASLIHPLGSDASLHLTLSAATKDLDIYGAMHCFSFLPLSGLIFTKLDETLAPGILMNVSSRTHLSLSYITHGYPLPGEIQVADAKEITSRILLDFTERESHLLRQISLIQDQKNCHINY